MSAKNETVLYSQLQPWSTVAADPCMEQVAGPPMPVRIGQYYQTPRPHPWRPTLGYENVEVMPLPSQPVTNAIIDPCYTPQGMATEPLKFPNLVTGFERNPAHAARAALYTRYTPLEWTQNNLRNYNESDTNKNYSERLRGEFIKVMRTAQHELETDVRSKEGALGIDNMCHQLNNFSKGINYYGGIEKYDPTVSTIQTWAENSNRIIQRSQSVRGKSAQMRSDIENLINTVVTEVWDAWSNTNNSLARRAAETLEAKSKLQMHLHKIQQEIFDIEKNIELIKKAIMNKSNPMKVAHTRLEARSHRKNVELCRDMTQERLVKEVVDMQDSIEYLHRKLQEAEAQHQQLLKTRSNLESELHHKVNSLFIDREKCMGMRRSFPITATIK
ncbi:Tektin, AIP3, SCP-1, Atg14, and/or Myosin tail 1 domain containing protein [Asbolus verrucosus]|uniref:Tektin n=1 Tax=Asbolus verrucosus TaxID=1661398 RepID=A0A482VNW7_ASBVE|nr:Tektin, AIP3, SCP-1, Atg14, and/or Myosin tail 1 domain containing protein [Asbolus verrucosus]